MDEDWVTRFTAKQRLAGRLTQTSTEKGIAYIETLIDDLLDGDDEAIGPSTIFGDVKRLQELQRELESLVCSTYNLAKMAVLVPSGLWG